MHRFYKKLSVSFLPGLCLVSSRYCVSFVKLREFTANGFGILFAKQHLNWWWRAKNIQKLAILKAKSFYQINPSHTCAWTFRMPSSIGITMKFPKKFPSVLRINRLTLGKSHQVLEPVENNPATIPLVNHWRASTHSTKIIITCDIFS